MKRLLLVCALLCACSSPKKVTQVQPKPATPPTFEIVEVAAIKPNLGLELVLSGLQKQMKLEMVMCLYGQVVRDTAEVITVQPAKIDTATTHSVWYQSCPRTLQTMEGVFLRYLGIWHNHPNNTCEFSYADDRSFRLDPDALIDWMSCPKLMERRKTFSQTKQHGT